MSNGLEIGTLSGRIELDDAMSSKIDALDAKLDKLVSSFGGVQHRVGETAAAFFTAEAAFAAVEHAAHFAVDTLKELTIQGSHAADIEVSFTHMAGGADRAEHSLAVLREGTRGTVTDMELMIRANQNMAAGLNLTDAQMRTLSQGAFALAKKEGIDVAAALDRISDAMVKGRVQGVQMLTGKIDLIKAEEDYAAKLNTIPEKLSAQEKQYAVQEAILARVAQATERVGDVQVRLADRITQAQVRMKNWEEELGTAIAISPNVVHAFDAIEQAVSGAFGGNMQDIILKWVNRGADAVAQYGPVIIKAFIQVKDWIVDIYDTVTTTWNALPDWMKDVAKNAVLAAVGTYALDKAVAGMHGTMVDFLSTASNATQVLTGFPALIGSITKISKELAVVWAVMDFSSLAGAGASLQLLAGAAVSAIGPLGAVALAVAAIAAAWQIGKLDTVSDAFQFWGLMLQGYSIAEADAMIKTDHLTQEQNKQAASMKNQGEATKSVKDLIHELTVQREADAAAAKKQEDAGARLINGVRVSQEEFKKYREVWKDMESMGANYQETLDKMNPSLVESATHWAEVGAKVADLTAMFPGLTKAQAEAVLKGVQGSLELRKVVSDTEDILAKMHGDNINDWIKSEDRKYKATLDMLKLTGKATQEMLKAELDLHTATIDAEIKKRDEQNQYSRNYYQKQFDDAKNAYDLILATITDHTSQEVRMAYQAMVEKERDLAHWASLANEKIESVTRANKTSVETQRKDLILLASEWDKVGTTINKDKEYVKALSGEVLTLKEYEARQLAGGSFEVNSQNFASQVDAFHLNATNALKLAKMGYSFQEIVQMLSGQGSNMPSKLPPPHGPRIPGFREGGIGDFGEGTLAVLHGQEAIVPLDSGKAFGGNVTNNWFINGTGDQVYQQLRRRLMSDLLLSKQFSALR